MGVYETLFGSDNDNLEATEQEQSFLEILGDNIIGFDNQRESAGEAIAKKFNEDELGFLKDMGIGMYEGAKEFVKAPIETTKEVVSDIYTGTKDLFTKDLDERLMDMYGVTREEATAEQINNAKEGVFGDALTASSLVPAAGVATTGAKSLATILPELEVEANTLGMNLGNIKLTKENKENLEDTTVSENSLTQLLEEATIGIAAGQAPKKTITGYRIYDTVPNTGIRFSNNWGTRGYNGPPMKGRPLFVNKGDHFEEGQWYQAYMGPVDPKNPDKIKASSINNVAPRGGFHSTTAPKSVHLGGKASKNSKMADYRKATQVWAEVEIPDDVPWQEEANRRMKMMADGVTPDVSTAEITDRVPTGGHYLFRTNPQQDAPWLVSGSVKIVKYLTREQAKERQKELGIEDLPYLDEIIERDNLSFDDLTGTAKKELKQYYPEKYEELVNKVPATVAEQTEDLLGNRISTRVPTTKSGKVILPETYNRDLEINTEVMREGKTLDKNLDFLATRRDGSAAYDGVDAGRYFPAFKGLENLDPEARLEYVNAMQQKNLEFILDRLPKQFQDRTKVWYEGANRLSGELADKYGVPQSAMSATIAALSPQMDWFSNVSLAERVADVVTNRRNMAFTPEMEAVAKRYPVFLKDKNRPIFESIKGKTYAELETDMQKAMWIRAYDQAYNPRTHRVLTPEGELGEIILNADGSPKAVSWGNFGEIAKAVKSIESNGDLNIISDALGLKHKVRNFYNNIEVPFSDFDDITIDTHAIAAGYMRPLGGSDPLVSQGLGTAGSSSDPTGAQGSYGFLADNYRVVAGDRGLRPRESQSIVWEAVRTLMDDKKTLPNKQKVNQIWNAYDRGDLTQEQALGLIEEVFGSFPQKVIDPNEKRTIKGGASTMFNKGGLVVGLMSPEEM